MRLKSSWIHFPVFLGVQIWKSLRFHRRQQMLDRIGCRHVSKRSSTQSQLREVVDMIGSLVGANGRATWQITGGYNVAGREPASRSAGPFEFDDKVIRDIDTLQRLVLRLQSAALWQL